MKTIYFILLVVYIIGALLRTAAVWAQNSTPDWVRQQKRSGEVCTTLAEFVLVGGFIFGLYATLLITSGLW